MAAGVNLNAFLEEEEQAKDEKQAAQSPKDKRAQANEAEEEE